MGKKILFWVIAVVSTIGISIYQRMTGPTHPKTVDCVIEGKEYSFKLSRSGGEEDCKILLKGFGAESIEGKECRASIFYKRYPTTEEFSKIEMQSTDEGFVGFLPVQPPAGKLEYYIMIESRVVTAESYQKKLIPISADDPLIIRFKGDVPAWVLIPHILAMFISMLLGIYTLLVAFANMDEYKKYLSISCVILLIGGFILGPIVQKYAFGVYWSGFPFGMDLTDNKTLLAAIFMLIAVFTRKYKWNRWVAIIAVHIMLIVFSIPHSMRGSELNHDTGVIESSKE